MIIKNNYMKKKYSTGTAINIIFFIIIIILIAGPYLGVRFYDEKNEDSLLILIILYAAYSPLTIMMIVFLRKYFSSYILVTERGLLLKYRKTIEEIEWSKVNSIHYDYTLVSGSRYSVIYEVKYYNKSFRFNTLMNGKETSTIKDITEINAFQKKAFSFESYGLYLSKKKCQNLIHDITMYSGREPEREKNLF